MRKIFTRAEPIGAVWAVVMFLLPRACVRAAMRGGIVSDFGCFFWIDMGGLHHCGRHKMRAFPQL
jgi:hypothetical protein